MSTPSKAGHFRLLDLPPEIREAIWSQVLSITFTKRALDDDYSKYVFDYSLFLVNHQVYYEARKIYRRDNVFVRIETPWPEAQNHVALDGHVPIIATGEQADRFRGYHMAVLIDAPQYQHLTIESRKFVVKLEDLASFTEVWKYSDLSHPYLNRHLRLTLKLRHPYALPCEQQVIPKAIEQKLLLPFGAVKGLHDIRVEGNHYDSVEKAMREAMAVPYVSPEQCLEDAEKLKTEGNAALQNKDYKRAIQLYEQSFGAVHIICSGRRRSIYGESYFEVVLRSGPFEGQNGRVVRTILRVRLVANIILAYLKLENYEEAHFWGMRSINLVRQSMWGGEEDQPVLGFPASNEMGKIYFRTGLACKALDDRSEARKLFKVAAAYLPHDEIVQRELASVALRLG